MPGEELVHQQRDQVGLPLHARPDAGGRLLRGGLQQLPRHLRDQHPPLQCQRAGRHDESQPPAPHLVAGQQAEPAGTARVGAGGPGNQDGAGRRAEKEPADGEERGRRQHGERVQSVRASLSVVRLLRAEGLATTAGVARAG